MEGLPTSFKYSDWVSCRSAAHLQRPFPEHCDTLEPTVAHTDACTTEMEQRKRLLLLLVWIIFAIF
jgi:hypothetical protein